MAVLTQLKTMKDGDIQNWLRKVSVENVEHLAKVLTAADPVVRECVFRNMSVKANSMLKEDIRKFSTKGVSAADVKTISLQLEKMF